MYKREISACLADISEQVRNDHCHSKIHRQVNENLQAYGGVQRKKSERGTSPRQHSVHAHGVYFLICFKKCGTDCNDMQRPGRHTGFHKKFQINFDLKIKFPLIM